MNERGRRAFASVPRLRSAVLTHGLSGIGREGLYVFVAFACTFLLGVALQVFAISALSTDDYGTFALGLSLGNVAAALGQSLQPVAAMARLSEQPHAGPSRSAVPIVVAVWLAATLVGSFASEPLIGVVLASQVPLHAAMAFGLGKIQADRRVGRLMIASSAYAPGRLAAALVLSGVVGASGAVLGTSLAAGLLVGLLVVGLAGGFADAVRSPIRLAPGVGTWLALAVLQNADLFAARAAFDDVESGIYALAFTVGRLPLFAGLLLSMVLLPAAAADRESWRRARALLILFLPLIPASAVLAAGAIPVIDWLSGQEVGLALMVLHLVGGTLAALLVLLATLLYARGVSPSWPWVLALALVPVAISSLRDSSVQLVAAQTAVTSVGIAWFAWRAKRLTPAVADRAGSVD